jgi:hypothetical protein
LAAENILCAFVDMQKWLQKSMRRTEFLIIYSCNSFCARWNSKIGSAQQKLMGSRRKHRICDQVTGVIFTLIWVGARIMLKTNALSGASLGRYADAGSFLIETGAEINMQMPPPLPLRKLKRDDPLIRPACCVSVRYELSCVCCGENLHIAKAAAIINKCSGTRRRTGESLCSCTGAVAKSDTPEGITECMHLVPIPSQSSHSALLHLWMNNGPRKVALESSLTPHSI